MILKGELQMWLNEKHTWNVISKNTKHCFVHDVKTYVFLNGEGLQNLILGIFTTKMLPKLCKSLICLVWLEMWFILLAISLINKSRDPFPFIYRLLENVRHDPDMTHDQVVQTLDSAPVDKY